MDTTDDTQGDHRVAFRISKEAHRTVRMIAADRMVPVAHLMAGLIEDYAKHYSISVSDFIEDDAK